MSGDREATSEQSSVRERAGYDKVFQSGHEPKEGFSWLLGRKTSAHSPNDEEESYDGEEGEVEEGEEGQYKDDEGGEDEEYRGEDDRNEGEGDERALEGGSSGSPKDGHTHPFILPNMWTVNDFKPTMMTNIFNNL